MKRVSIDSTMIKSIGFEWAGHSVHGSYGTLEVEFNNGSVYQYSDVLWTHYLHVRYARHSAGRMLNALVKANGYAFKRVA